MHHARRKDRTHESDVRALGHREKEEWSWSVAFSRNRGLIREDEQRRLQNATVAIAGAGGVGGSHALQLARQGVGGFVLADPDTFSVANFNRQVGANLETVGRNKAEVMASMVADINPEARVTTLREVSEATVERFVTEADVVIDGLDAFALTPRRLLHKVARAHGKWVLVAGPLGFGTAMLAFSPDGPSFEDHCGFEPNMSALEEFVAFFAALAPSGLHAKYLDFREVNFLERTGPSAALACELASSLVAMETLALLLGRRAPRAVPYSTELDLYGRVFRVRRRYGSGRSPFQRLRRAILLYLVRRHGVLPEEP